MKTNGDFVARVTNGLKLLNKDEHISRRYILNIGTSKARTYSSQKLGDRTLYREDNLYTVIDCFEMKPDNIVECDIIEFKKCSILMKSKKPLPELLYSKYGPAVLYVTTLDGEIAFDYADPATIRNASKRQFGSVTKYYTIVGNCLYIPNYEVEAVKVSVLTLDAHTALSDCGCKEQKCLSVWDAPFICPDKLYENVAQETINEVFSTFRRVVADENPNMDSTQKTQNIQ